MPQKQAGREFHKDTYFKTSQERRQRIFDVAVKEFSSNGYNATNIKDIVRKTGISIGALYSYFASKEDLFMAIVDKGLGLLQSIYGGVKSGGDLFETYEKLLRASRDAAREYPELIKIYVDMTTQGLSCMSARLSVEIEPISVDYYREAIKSAKDKGLVSGGIEESVCAFCLDNLLLAYLFSFSSDYYKRRVKIFLGDDMQGDSDTVIENIMRFVRKALS